MKRVVIVGAGPCGLVALKEMLQAGHDATLFERSEQLGGVFASATAYPNLHLTITNWAMAFSDFPDRTRLRYTTATEYLQYLHDYARHFGLERHIQYGCEVERATLRDNEIWSLQVGQKIGTERSIFHLQADALIVATGSNQVPNVPPAGLAGYEGRIIHSSEYDEVFKRDVAEMKLKVLVVGGGESGADIAAELGDLSPNVTVWLRRPICVGPRYLVKDDEMEQVEANKTRDFPANSFLEAATTNRMSAAQNVYVYGLFRRLLWHTSILNSTLSRMCLASTASAPFRNDQATYVTKNQRMCEALHSGKIEVIVSPTISTKSRGCTFPSAAGRISSHGFDAVVLCTGFRTEFSWIHVPGRKPLSSNPRSWFLHCFPESLGHCLFFVGYARPHQGGVPVMAEMLSRYIALLLRGDKSLPVDYALQAQRDAAAQREYYSLSPNLHTLVDYNAFLESVARRIDCEPRLPLSCIALFNFHMATVLVLALQLCCSLLPSWTVWYTGILWQLSTAGFVVLHEGLLIKWWFYPHWAVWYRQRGPNADLSLLDETVKRVDLWRSTAITPGFVLLVLWSIPTLYAQHLLSVFMFVPSVIVEAFGVPWPQSLGGLLRPKLFALHGCRWRLVDLFMP
ncbi:hypothetical protein H2200_005462 [Cladophialophora chaetospira]|uniref:FAD/NAD(P)-binding domain-containing protein n=1 Tax=Cladophialophora chaetospira TaxID=386627 RepID=A0AA38XC21_9EURO|nr:hypothetical protein H2200_005462 [Cladophialophora chaetospira]